MKRIVIESPGKITINEADIPVRKPGEALLKTLWGGICGSDLNSYRGSFAYVTYPRTPGHEFSAEIIEIDENVPGLTKGMVVTCNPYFNCGNCYSCERGMLNCCIDNQTMGVQREGAFSEYITMPIDRIYNGQGLSGKTLALIEPFCISMHGIKKARIKENEHVLIVGAGTIGILAAIYAKHLGAEVTLCDVAADKLNFAKKAGADHIILNDNISNFLEKVNQATGGKGFDITVEAVGSPFTFQNCIDAAAFGGRMLQIGVGKTNADFNFTLLQKKELSVYGSRNALKEDFLEAISLAQSGKVDLEQIVTDIYPFTDAAEAFKDFDAHAGEKLKVLLRF